LGKGAAVQLETLADVKLTARALTSGWLDGFEEKRRAAVESLFEVVETSPDDEMKVEAFDALLRADAADLKREELAIKRQEADDARRLKYLEILTRLPPGELGKLTSVDAGSAEVG